MQAFGHFDRASKSAHVQWSLRAQALAACTRKNRQPIYLMDLPHGFRSMLDHELIKIIDAGEVIFREGDRGLEAYIILSGQVELFTEISGSYFTVGRLAPGDLFGEMALLDGEVRSASAKATEQTELLVIQKEYVDNQFKLMDPVINLCLRVILERFREIHFRMYFEVGKVIGNLLPERNDDRLRLKKEADIAARTLSAKYRLQKAVENEEFHLNYQPIVDLKTSGMVGCEALIRWQTADGLVAPDEFIPLAEDTGLIIPIGYWVMFESCKALGRIKQALQQQGGNKAESFTMSVNLSGKQFEEVDLIQKIGEIIAQEGLHASQIKVELTESLLMSNPDLALISLQEMKALGVTIAIDDFGTGYSSFNYLHRFPIDTLKIDRSFTRALHNNQKSREIVRSLITLANKIGIDVIAEGVDELEDAELLRLFCCNMGQGYLYSKPLTEQQLLEKIQDGGVDCLEGGEKLNACGGLDVFQRSRNQMGDAA
jgi:EAL domain-containing protein (putative c-di-GMP-specific phosphodiesterase class I)/CRP-like cAMP-binding protein